jgi:hypothetical protein
MELLALFISALDGGECLPSRFICFAPEERATSGLGYEAHSLPEIVCAEWGRESDLPFL